MRSASHPSRGYARQRRKLLSFASVARGSGGTDQDSTRQEGSDGVNLGFLRALYENQQDEPQRPMSRPMSTSGYVSVYLDVSPGTESAATEVALRWRAARERLAAAGADEATLDATEQAVTERVHSARARAVFATGGSVRLSGSMPEPPAREISSLAPLPHVVPLLAQRPPRLAHVRVAADRRGGRVLAIPSDGAVGATDITGEQRPVHKVSTAAGRRLACSAQPKRRGRTPPSGSPKPSRWRRTASGPSSSSSAATCGSGRWWSASFPSR